MYILLKYLLLLSLITIDTQALDKIKLQLEWKHQFEFAGFYAAQKKGYYEEVGLDVEFVEYDTKTDITQEVLDDNAQYGITYASIVAEYLSGKPVVLVANFFKQSPLVIVAQANITTPSHLKNKIVMGVSNSIDNIILLTMLDKFGVSMDNIHSVPSSFNIDDFISKKVDAMSIFTTNEIFKLNQAGMKYNIFDPTVYGARYYDINLFTTAKEAKNNPMRVKNFRDASIKGWEYALSHQDEIIELILKKYNTQNKTKEAYVFEAKQIEQLMLTHLYKVGSIDMFRIKSMADIFIQSGLIKNIQKREINQFVFKDSKHTINLTKEEKEFIKNHPTIVLGTGDSWAPYSIKNSDGSISGYDNDILTLINKSTGANFVQQLGDWSEIQKMQKQKK
jgi:ABC-type nitrate/sulfonate/bicarbonate transport system substrate-binding protein